MVMPQDLLLHFDLICNILIRLVLRVTILAPQTNLVIAALLISRLILVIKFTKISLVTIVNAHA